ncbi:MAG: long-chain fatty acid--CoA ligase [Deltaproteobacteria bacterium]|nr:long-chain fatty acid--CoA ligase [Deltaproteobacteria bacterium]
MKVTSIYDRRPWLNHYENGVPHEISFTNALLPDFLETSAQRFPNNSALNFEGYRVSYRKLNSMVDRISAHLYSLGVRKGDAVAILLPNLISCVICYYAIIKIGGIAVMNNPLYSDRELEHQFNDSGAKILITLDLLANRMIELRPRTQIKQIIYATAGDFLPPFKKILFKLFGKIKRLTTSVKKADNLYCFNKLIKKPSPPAPKIKISLDDVAMYQYTGGTTGISKGVMLNHGNLSNHVQQLKAWLPRFKEGEEVMLGALPFFHVFGLTACMNFSILMGWENVIVAKPQAENLIKAITKQRPTFAPMVPTMFINILSHPDIAKADMSSIRACFSGSAPMPVEAIKEFEAKTSAVILEGYGLTESSPIVCVNPFSGTRKAGSIGIPFPNTHCRIVSIKDGKTDVPQGECGELIIRGPQVMKGYYKNIRETGAVLKDEWLYTGDVARMDEDGYFYIVDRIKELIISGGYNVYPRDIEEVLYTHPDILEAAVIGIPHPSRGEVVKVFAVLKEGRSLTQKALIDYCAKRLAKYKLPVKVEFRQSLPKSTVGKILKKVLKEEEMKKSLTNSKNDSSLLIEHPVRHVL